MSTIKKFDLNCVTLEDLDNIGNEVLKTAIEKLKCESNPGGNSAHNAHNSFGSHSSYSRMVCAIEEDNELEKSTIPLTLPVL